MENKYLHNKNKIKSGFSTPDNYFDDFSKQMLAQLPKNETKVISFYQANKNWILTTAAMVVLALLIPSLSLFNKDNSTIEITDLETYILNTSSITQEDIVDLLDESDIQKLNIDYKLENISSENIDLDTIDLEQNL